MGILTSLFSREQEQKQPVTVTQFSFSPLYAGDYILVSDYGMKHVPAFVLDADENSATVAIKGSKLGWQVATISVDQMQSFYDAGDPYVTHRWNKNTNKWYKVRYQYKDVVLQ